MKTTPNLSLSQPANAALPASTGNTGLRLKYKVVGQPVVNIPVASIADAVTHFERNRDGVDANGSYTFLDFGSRDLRSKVLVVDGDKVVADINYNGTLK